MRQSLESSHTDFELGPVALKIDAGRSLDDVSNVSAANARAAISRKYIFLWRGFQGIRREVTAANEDRGPASGCGFEGVEVARFPRPSREVCAS